MEKVVAVTGAPVVFEDMQADIDVRTGGYFITAKDWRTPKVE